MTLSQDDLDAIALESIRRVLNKTMPEFFGGRRPGFVLVVSFDQQIAQVSHVTNACPACARRLIEQALRELPADLPHTHGPAS